MKNPITYVIDTVKYSLFSDTHTIYSTVPGQHAMEERTYRLTLSERLWDLAENLYTFECVLCHGRYGYRIGPIDLEKIPVGRPRWNEEDGYMENSVASKLYDFGMYLCQKNNYSWEATPLTRRKLTEAEAASLCPDLYSSYQVDPEYPDELPCTYGATHDTCPGCLQYASRRGEPA